MATMQTKSWAIAFLCLVWVGCGHKATETPSPVDPQVQTVEGDGDLVVGVTPARDLVVIAVDGLRLGAWPAGEYPHLAALLREGRGYPNHIAQSTGAQAQLATLLTGLAPIEHGVGSVHERGRTFLTPSLRNFAQAWQASGGQTLASVALPQYGPQVGGMDVGFDVFAAPDVLAEAVRDSERVHMVAQEEWRAALPRSKPLFALWHVADFLPAGLRATTAVTHRVQEALRALLPQYPGLAQATEEVVKGPEAFESVRRALLRQRGSIVYQRFLEAVYAGQLQDLDAFVGTVMSELEAANRLASCAVVLVSLRGSQLGTTNPDGPALAPEILRAPLLVWAPGRIQPGQDERLLTTRDVAWLMGRWTGRAFGEDPGRPAAVRVCDASMTRWASFGPTLQMEQNSAAGSLSFDRVGAPLLGPERLSKDEQAEWAALEADLQRPVPAFGYQLEFDLPPDQIVEVSWRTLEGRYRGAHLEPAAQGPKSAQLGRSTPMAGRATLQGQGTLWIETYQREEPLVLGWSGATGPAICDQGPRLWVLGAPQGELLETTPEIQWLRDGGVWTRIWAQGASDRGLRLWTALVPAYQDMGRLESELEWTTGPNEEVEWIPGRTSGAELVSRTPINCQFKEPPDHALAIALQIDGTWVAPEAMGLEQAALFTDGAGQVYLPDWWPGLTEGLDAGEGWGLCPGLQLKRASQLAGEHRALPAGSMEFVQRLGRGE